jgi:hypothetical protein
MPDDITYKNHRLRATPQQLTPPNQYLPCVVVVPPPDIGTKAVTLEYIGGPVDSRAEAVRIAHVLGRAYVDTMDC